MERSAHPQHRRGVAGSEALLAAEHDATVIRRSFLAPAAYLLVPAVLLAFGIEQFPVEETSSTLLAVVVAGLLFSAPILLGMSRLGLWNVRQQLAPTAPSRPDAQAGPSVSAKNTKQPERYT